MSEKLRRVALWRPYPSSDWKRAHVGYRLIKLAAQVPVEKFARMRVRGTENVPTEGPALLAVNHHSWADPVLLGAAIHRPAFYLAKEGVFRNPVTRKFFLAMGQIKVDRETGGNEAAIATAVNALREGKVIGVFPEGTRSRPGQVRRGKTGIARIAALTGAPVVPCAVETQSFWPRGRTLPRLGEKVYVNIGKPMKIELRPEDAADRERMRDVTDEIMERIRELLEEAVRAKEAGERWT